MRRYAVIIKHTFRDNDYRVDIYDVQEDVTIEDIEKSVLMNLMGNFVIVSTTERVSFDNKIKP